MAKISISKEKFFETLRKSKVLDASGFSELKTRFAEQEDPGRIAKHLIDTNVLTRWQAKMLLTGRSRLKIGKYILEELITRDSLGDRFVAHHLTLDRKVELQILPAALAEHPENFSTFIQQAQRASTLDHPHLIHVYDIDKESGRYYLVLEHVTGELAAEVGLDELSDVDVAIITGQALDGIRTAHSEGIVHGQLGLDRFLLHEKNDLRIMDISVSTLRRQLNSDTETNTETDSGTDSGTVSSTVGDFKDIGRASIELIKRCQRSSSAASLLDCLTKLTRIENENDIDPIHRAIKSWVEDNMATNDKLFADSTDVFSSSDSSVLPESELDEPSTQTLKAPETSKSPVANKTKPQRKPAKKKPPAKSKAGSRKKPSTGLMAGLGGLLAVLLLGGGYLIVAPMLSGSNGSDADKKRANASEENRPAKSVNKKTDRSSNKTPVEKSKSSAIAKPKEQVEAKRPSRENTNNDKSASEQKPQFDEDGFPVTNRDEDSSTVNDSDSATPNEWPGTTLATDDSGNNAEVGSAAARGPFDGFPTALELPSASPDSTVDQKIILAQLVPESGRIESLVLLQGDSDETMGGKLTIRGAGSEQKWMVGLELDDGSVDVAQFEFAETQLTFNWLASIHEHPSANYLRNCKLQVDVAGESRTAFLRQAITLEPLRLDKKRYNVTASVSIPWLPAEKFLVLETQTDLIDEFPEVWFANDINKLDAGVGDGELRMAFDEDVNNRFLWVRLKQQIRKNKIKLDLQVSVQPLVQRPIDQNFGFYAPDFDINNAFAYRPKVYNDMIRTVSNFRKAMNGAYTQRKHLYDTRVIEKGRRAYNDLNDKLSDVLTQTDAYLEALDIQKSIVDELTEQAIPVRILMKFGENDLATIARTPVGGSGIPPYVDLTLGDNSSSVKNVLKNSELTGSKGEFVDWEFEFTRGGGNNDRFVKSKSNNEVSIEIYDGRGSFFQSNVNQDNLGGSKLGTAQLRFMVGWSDSGKSDSSRLTLAVGTVTVFELLTPTGDSDDPLVPKALGGATMTVADNSIPENELRQVTIGLPRSIEKISDVRFSWTTGHDDFKIDNVQLLVDPETGLVSRFSKGAPAMLVGHDCLVSDPDSSQLHSAKIVLTNAKEGDRFLINDEVMESGSEQSIPGTLLKYRVLQADGGLTIELFGAGPIAQYLFALKSIKFDSSSEISEDRYIDITLSDGNSESGVVSTVIAFD